MTPKAQATTRKIGKFDFIKIKILMIKGHYQESEKYNPKNKKNIY